MQLLLPIYSKKILKKQSFGANFKIFGDFLDFFIGNCNYEFFQKGGLLRFDWSWSSLTSDALDQTPPSVPMGQTLFHFFGSREVCSINYRAYWPLYLQAIWPAFATSKPFWLVFLESAFYVRSNTPHPLLSHFDEWIFKKKWRWSL